jgi:DNA transposition AAA+ family ATPase
MKTELKKEIVTKLDEYMNTHNISQNEVAKKSGVNVAYISAIRAGKTTTDAGNNKTVVIDDKWFVMLAQYIGLKTERSYWEVVDTDQLKRQLATLEDAKEYGYTNVIVGPTGCGKTYVSNLFAKNNPVDLFLITVGQSDNIGDLLDKIIDKLKITSPKTRSKKLRDIVAHLRMMKLQNYKPMLIFDEAEYMKQPALCAMKELYDNLNGICAVVMIGTDQLIKNIERMRKKNKDGIPQLYRRIKFGIRVLPPINKEFKQFLNGLNDMNLVKFLRENCDNYGELYDALVPAMREADRLGKPLTENFVRTILNMPAI